LEYTDVIAGVFSQYRHLMPFDRTAAFVYIGKVLSAMTSVYFISTSGFPKYT
jgi:hypothetical protein